MPSRLTTKSRNRKIAVQFCFLRWLRLQISVTYRKYAPSFAAFAALSCTICRSLSVCLRPVRRPSGIGRPPSFAAPASWFLPGRRPSTLCKRRRFVRGLSHPPRGPFPSYRLGKISGFGGSWERKASIFLCPGIRLFLRFRGPFKKPAPIPYSGEMLRNCYEKSRPKTHPFYKKTAL